jgi:hypothetical protein|tara:strand:+ start:1741 stop:1965 length:225 start_codon:yes stop_codon:yes gene_type:complete
MNKKEEMDNIGVIDIKIFDKNYQPIFKLKGKNLGQGITELKEFLGKKYGINFISDVGLEEYLEKKYNIKGVGFR